jgi:FkbM family methyltransferase
MEKIKIGFDIGAETGNSLYRFHDYDKIYCFEPYPEVYEQLYNNTKENDRIKCFNIAIANFDGEAYFNCHQLSGFSSLLDMDEESEFAKKCQSLSYPGCTIITKKPIIKVKKLKTIINDESIPYINYIKIDTQGNDLEVIKSLEEKITHVEQIHMEVQLKPLYKNGAKPQDIMEYMTSKNFELIHAETNGGAENIGFEDNWTFQNKKFEH